MLTFDEWFNKRFPQAAWLEPEVSRLAFKQLSLEVWNASRENLSKEL